MTGPPVRRVTLTAALALSLALGCAACVPTAVTLPMPVGSAPSVSADPAPAPTLAAASAKDAAWTYRLRTAAAAGRAVAYLEFLCTVPGRDGRTVYVALHERTRWHAAGAAHELDAVLAQPVTPAGGGTWVAGVPVTVRSRQDGRLASDAIAGLAGPGHRCSASFIGPPVAGG